MRRRSFWAGGALLAVSLSVTTSAVLAQSPTKRPEVGLLGVPLLSTFRTVLNKFGQPTVIQPGTPSASALPAAPTSQTGNNQRGGGLPGLPGMPGGMMGAPGMMGPGGPGMGGYGNSMPGMPGGMTGAPGMMGPGGPGMGGYGNSMPGMPGGMMGAPGMMGPGGPGMGGLSRPGIGGRRGAGGPGMGFPGGGGMGGMMNSEEAPNLTTWWYNFPKLGIHYSFLFNKQGRVIQIQAYGDKPQPHMVNPKTAEGITFGSSLGTVVQRYGWSNSGTNNGSYVQLEYGLHNRIAFQLSDNHVVGIVLGVVETQKPRYSANNG